MILEFRNGETGHYPVCSIAYHDGSPTADNVGYRAKTLNVEPHMSHTEHTHVGTISHHLGWTDRVGSHRTPGSSSMIIYDSLRPLRLMGGGGMVFSMRSLS
jgi:hypothetical protein